MVGLLQKSFQLFQLAVSTLSGGCIDGQGEKILKPFIATVPVNIIPLLVLDSYRCHMMSLEPGLIQQLGVEVEHIPS